MKILLDNESLDHKDCKIDRLVNAAGKASITLRDLDGSLISTYSGKRYKRVDIRHDTLTPFENYKQITVNNKLPTSHYVHIDPLSFTESDQYCFYDSLSLRYASDYDQVMDCYDNFSSLDNWTQHADTSTTVTLLDDFGRYKYVVELDDDSASGYCGISDTFTAASSGTTYIIIAAGQTDAEIDMVFNLSGDTEAFTLKLYSDGAFHYEDSGGDNDSDIRYSASAFYIFKVAWASNAYTWSYYDSTAWVEICASKAFVNNGSIEELEINTISADSDSMAYIAAVDYSWASGYSSDRILTATSSSQYSNTEEDEREFQAYNKIMDCWENFEDDDDFGLPAINWDTSEGANTNVWILPRFDGYKKVLECYDNGGAAGNLLTVIRTFDSTQESGTVYFIVRPAQDDQYFYCYLRNGGVLKCGLYFWTDGKIYAPNGAGNDEVMTYSANTTYIFKIDFECGDGGYQGLAADTYDAYCWDSSTHSWTQIADGKGFVAAVANMDSFIFGTSSSSQPVFYVMAVDTSWASGYATDRILYISACDIALHDAIPACGTNKYRLFYSSEQKSVPNYYADDYDDLTTSGTDPITITTDDDVATVELTTGTPNNIISDLTDVLDVDWVKAINRGVITSPDFSATTRGNTSKGPVFVENILFTGSNEYAIVRTYKDGLIEVIACNDATWSFYGYHDQSIGTHFCDKVYYYKSGWQVVSEGAGVTGTDTVTIGMAFMEDNNDKAQIWPFIWDEDQCTNADMYRWTLNTTTDLYFQNVGNDGSHQIAANQEVSFLTGVITPTNDETDLDAKKERLVDLYDLYIDGNLVIGSFGSRTTNPSILNYRLFVGELTESPRFEKDKQEIYLTCYDYVKALQRNDINFCSIQTHKNVRIASGGVSATQITCEGDVDGDGSWPDNITHWDSDVEPATNAYAGYGLILIDNTRDTDSFCFPATATLAFPFTLWIGSSDPEVLRIDEGSIAATNILLDTIRIVLKFDTITKASVTELTFNIRCGISKRSMNYFYIEVYNNNAGVLAYEILETLSGAVGVQEVTFSITSSASDYVNASDEIYVRLRGHSNNIIKPLAIMHVYKARCQANAAPFISNQYAISTNTTTAITISSGDMDADGALATDGVMVAPKNEDILTTLIEESPNLESDEIDTLIYYSGYDYKGTTALAIMQEIKNREGAKFWQDLKRSLNFKTSFTSSGVTINNSKVLNYKYNVDYTPESELCTRCQVQGKTLSDGSSFVSDWYHDTDASETLGQIISKIETNESLRSKYEADKYAEEYVSKHKEQKIALIMAIDGDDEDFIDQDILGKTFDVSVDQISETAIFCEGISWSQDINGRLTGMIRLGEDPATYDPEMMLAFEMAKDKREIKQLKAGRAGN